MIEVVISLVIFHTVDGREVAVNPTLVTSVYTSRDGEPNKLYVEDVHCVIGLTDGRFITVAETCSKVRKALEAAK